ncbi:hypothetical protein PTKU46_80690 [Paraburkholderia terrae]
MVWSSQTDRVEIRLQAYPDAEGRFDRITSLGMFEFDGRSDLPEHIAVLQERLAADGVLVSHGIMSTGPGSGRFVVDDSEFCSRYVFPDEELARSGLRIDTNARRRTRDVIHSEPAPALREDAAFVGGELQGKRDGAAATR